MTDRIYEEVYDENVCCRYAFYDLWSTVKELLIVYYVNASKLSLLPTEIRSNCAVHQFNLANQIKYVENLFDIMMPVIHKDNGKFYYVVENDVYQETSVFDLLSLIITRNRHLSLMLRIITLLLCLSNKEKFLEHLNVTSDEEYLNVIQTIAYGLNVDCSILRAVCEFVNIQMYIIESHSGKATKTHRIGNGTNFPIFLHYDSTTKDWSEIQCHSEDMYFELMSNRHVVDNLERSIEDVVEICDSQFSLDFYVAKADKCLEELHQIYDTADPEKFYEYTREVFSVNGFDVEELISFLKSLMKTKYHKHDANNSFYIQQTTGNGNCFYNSLSYYFVGNESLSTVLRIVCIFCFFKNVTFFRERYLIFMGEGNDIYDDRTFLKEVSTNRFWANFPVYYAIILSFECNLCIRQLVEYRGESIVNKTIYHMDNVNNVNTICLNHTSPYGVGHYELILCDSNESYRLFLTECDDLSIYNLFR